MDNDTIREHCGSNAFSPPAPPELCAQVNHVPEPGTIALLLIALALLFILRRKK